MSLFKTVLIVLCFGFIASSWGEEDKSLLFYCGFDGTVEATKAAGDGHAQYTAAPEFQPGVHGEAVLIGKGKDGKEYGYTYASEKNLDWSKGTISFWMKVLDWQGDNNYFNIFFQTGAGKNLFMIYKYCAMEQLYFVRGEVATWLFAGKKIGDWRPGEWHHIVCVWNDVESRVFIDGRMFDSKKLNFPVENLLPRAPFTVGIGKPNLLKDKLMGKSLIDEFRIYDRELSLKEIQQLYLDYAAASGKKSSSLLTVGMTTPKLDGTINQYEYSFAGTGLTGTDGVFIHRKNQYFISYDEKNLYAAFSSGFNPGEKDSEHIKVFLTPENDKNFVLDLNTDGICDVKENGKPINSTGIEVRNKLSGEEWVMEMAVPFKTLGYDNVPESQSWRINIGREFTRPSEIASMGQVVGKLDDQSNFCKIVFRAAAPKICISGLFNNAERKTAVNVSAIPYIPDTEIEALFISDSTNMYGMRNAKHKLFTQGKGSTFDYSGKKMDEFALYSISIDEKTQGKSIPLFYNTFIEERPIPMRTLFFYTLLDRKALSVFGKKNEDGEIQVRFLKDDKTEIFRARQKIPDNCRLFNTLFDLDFSKITPETYTVKIDYVSPSGKETETYSQAYRVPPVNDPLIQPYVDPEAEKVPVPWSPLNISDSSVGTWGRLYDFSNGILFSSLQSQNKELLTAPASICLDGTELKPVNPVETRKISGNDVVAEYEKKADLGKLRTESRLKVHFDGYCEVSMKIIPPASGLTVQKLSLDIPFRNEMIKLVNDGITPGNAKSKSGAVGDKWFQTLTPLPALWLGDYKVGFNFTAENLENWHYRNPDRNVEIIRQGGRAILRFNLIDYQLKLNEPITYKFGFTVTPAKPLNHKILRSRLHIDWQMWSVIWNYFASPDYDNFNKQQLANDCSHGWEVFLYMAHNFASPFMPEWGYYEQQWRQIRPPRTYGVWTGAHDGYCEGCLNCEGYRNFRLNLWKEFFTKAKKPLHEKAINYYFDAPWETSCRNKFHGCSQWQDSLGRKYDHLLVNRFRETALNVYRMIKRTGPDAKVSYHAEWPRLAPVHNFTDVTAAGEGPEHEVANRGSYFDLFTPESFCAFLSPYICGNKTSFMPQLIRGLWISRPEKMANFDINDPKNRLAVLHYMGYAVVHDVDIWGNEKEITELNKILWASQDKIGWDEKIKFHPYWEQDAVKVDSPSSSRIMASAYTRNGNLMLAILNDTAKDERVKITLDLKKLEVAGGLAGADSWNPECKYTLSSEWEDNVPARGFRLIVFSRNEPSAGK
ncbi:MAG: hypothetical protein A2020_03845 [Lentisphaerae bacterium GWF2_45_14]|nr:MAG: hypothetical protein A2020_03845 [Lentisphaerae bacterium GWF2_45_14]